MCESCSSRGLDRREFLAAAGAIGAVGVLSKAMADQASTGLALPLAKRDKQAAKVMAAFLYPPAEVVNEGKNEDTWKVHNWFTWPGNQFEPEQQERKFTAKIKEIAGQLGITIEFEPKAIYQEAKVKEFIGAVKAAKPDAVLIVNFWNTFAKWSYEMATASDAPTAIVYQPVGSSHQLPPEYLRNAEGVFYIHSVENWDEIERGLSVVNARKMLAQSRLLRVSGKTPSAISREPKLDIEIVEAHAEELNRMFDDVQADDAIVRRAMEFKRSAARVTDVTDQYFIEGMRAHVAVGRIMERYGADAITVECLQLKHRKPCISFATNNGALIPSGCENDLNATLTLMLGRWLLGRGGFQHNPDFDMSNNRYYGSHCTCTWKLHGPQAAAQEIRVRPFFHQLPKTAALDVQWPAGEPVMLAKYLSGQDTLACWAGKVIESPASTQAGGCATRVLVDFPDVDDICKLYAGPHPILFCGDRGHAHRFKAFARMYRLKLQGNV